jgi:hypothetical protein
MATPRALPTLLPDDRSASGDPDGRRRRETGGRRLGGLLASDESLRQLAAVPAPSRRREGPGNLEGLREHFTSGSELLRQRSDAATPDDSGDLFPTALPVIDAVLCGGLARGCLTELRGSASSGRLSLVLSLLAAATARGETAVLVDLGDQLDPQAAARSGVALERLLWARPARLREALAAAEIALGGAFPLVVLELGTPPVRGAGADEHAWLRLARAARHHRGALLVSTPYRITGTAAAEVLALSRRRGVWLGAGTSPRLLAGVESRLQREKSRRQPGAPAAAGLAWRAAELVAGAGEQLSLWGRGDLPATAIAPPMRPVRPVETAAQRQQTPAATAARQQPEREAPGRALPGDGRAAVAKPAATPAAASSRPLAARPAAGAAVMGPTSAVKPPVRPAAASLQAPAAKPGANPAVRPTLASAQPSTPAPRRTTRPRPLPQPPAAPLLPIPRRRVPRWVPLARAALAESMLPTGRAPSSAVSTSLAPPPLRAAPATARERPV